MGRFSRFTKELMAIGTTEQDLSKALGLSLKTIHRYRSGKLPKLLVRLQRYPRLLRALADDAEREDMGSDIYDG